MTQNNFFKIKVGDKLIAKTLEQKIIEADFRGGKFLARANEADERGDIAKAEKLFEKVQYWMNRSNKLRGNA